MVIRNNYLIPAVIRYELPLLEVVTKKEISKVEPCPALLEAFQPEWHHIEEVKEEILSPKIKGIFINTTWAVQAETLKEELLGSSDGTADQSFTLSKTPIITEGIWVNELGTITEEERSNIIEKAEFEVRETKEEEGKVTELWVKWKPVENFLASSKDDRHYEIDRVSGEVKFGDGIYGKIPPIGRDNITVDYRSGGGSKGNVIAEEIKDLKSSIAYVDKASNPLAAGGGTDVEDIDECIERGPLVLKHRNRAVTASDFEEIAYQASRAIVRAKCLPNFDNQGHFKPGWVTVIVIPESGEDKPKLSLQLKRQVETHLREHSANTLQLQVSEPVYAEASVTTILIATDIDAIPIVEKEAFIMLRGFLHPLTGGYEGKGWEFGRMPCISDFYALLEKIDGVDYVKELSVDLRTYAEDKIISEILITPERQVDIEIPPYAVVYSGEHEITVNIEKTAGGK
jgi:predicted phage baseplate assembly protein